VSESDLRLAIISYRVGLHLTATHTLSRCCSRAPASQQASNRAHVWARRPRHCLLQTSRVDDAATGGDAYQRTAGCTRSFPGQLN